MKKTITATCRKSGAKIISRHCYPHVLEKISDTVSDEAERILDSTDFDLTVTDKIEF